ncbi:MAG: alanine/glycine:cation symporter family protein [Bacilli bacterium]
MLLTGFSMIENFASKLENYVWSMPLIILLVATGIFFSIATRFVQVRRIPTMWKLLMKKESSSKGVSSFQAFALSIANRVGTGNIIGVASAIAYGGPGALFWMWFIAILGAASAYIESTLAQIYKEEVDGEYRGGPAYYFSKITGKKIYGIIFSVFALISVGVFLPGVQSNAIAVAVNNSIFIDASEQTQSYVSLAVGLFVAIILGLVIFGGIKRIGRVAEFIVPIMSLIYISMALIIIVVNFKYIPETFTLIFKEAFSPNAALGGVIGTAVLNGVKRGVFSSESGQGTCPHSAAAAEVNHPAEQGLVQAFSVYFDTLLVCSATGFMIIITQSYQLINTSNSVETVVYQAENLKGIDPNSIASGANFIQYAVSSTFGSLGSIFIAIALFFFAFTTLMANYYTAETNIAFLTIKKDNTGEHASKFLINIVRVTCLVAVVFFATKKVEVAWNFAFIGVGVMAWYNVIGIILCSKPAIKALFDYEKQLKNSEKIKFNPKKLGIKNTDENIW